MGARNWINFAPHQQRRPLPFLLSLSFFYFSSGLGWWPWWRSTWPWGTWSAPPWSYPSVSRSMSQRRMTTIPGSNINKDYSNRDYIVGMSPDSYHRSITSILDSYSSSQRSAEVKNKSWEICIIIFQVLIYSWKVRLFKVVIWDGRLFQVVIQYEMDNYSR